MYGLTSSGFIIKRLADSKLELEAVYRAAFGAGIKVSEDTVFGKLIAVQAERESVWWELLQAVYNSAYPNSATGIQLDRVCEITAVTRNEATSSLVTAYMAGTASTAIPIGTLFATQDSGEQFRALSAASLTGANFSITALTSAAWIATATAVAHGRPVGSHLFVNGAVEEDYNGLVEILTVPDADTFTYAIPGLPSSPATGTIDADPATAVACESIEKGAIEALSGTLTEIVNNISGLDRVENYLDAARGNNQEADTELRIRRINALLGIAAARLEGVRSYLLLVENVTNAKVFENTTMYIDGSGRPAKSIECLVVGGATQDILDAVFDRKAAGIEPHGSVSGTVTDSQGDSHTVKFSRPTPVNIYLELDLSVDANYPAGGDTLVENAILAYNAELEIGEDVIVFPYLVTSLGEIPGITDIVIRIGITASPTTDDNVVVDETGLAAFDTSRITIAHV